MMFRIATNQFGYLMYAANLDPPFSDQLSEAYRYYDGEDNRKVKLTYWRAVATNLGLDPSKVHIIDYP